MSNAANNLLSIIIIMIRIPSTPSHNPSIPPSLPLSFPALTHPDIRPSLPPR